MSKGFTAPHNGTDTSRASAASMSTSIGPICSDVLAQIRLSGGATCAELEASLGLSHQTCSARVWDLRRLGYIKDSAARRPTPTGRNAKVWTIQ